MLENIIPQRELLRLSLIGGLGVLLAGVSTWSYATRVEPAWIEVKEVHLRLKRLTPAFEGFRLVQMSDFHLGGWMDRRRLDRAVELALSLEPDVVALTGDYLDGHGWSEHAAMLLDDLSAALRPLVEHALTLSILGNHDQWSRAQPTRAMLRRAGIVELNNEVYTLRRGGECLHLAGVDDIYAGHPRLDKVLAEIPGIGAAILLAHEPDYADISAVSGRFDLQISGHTHGGQIVLPLVGPPVLPRFGKRYPAGLYRVGQMYQYTNRGLGMGHLAVRFNCRPEITVFVLSAGEAV